MKKFITVALVALLALGLVAGFAACDTKSETVRALMIQGGDGSDYIDYYLGDFYYKKSADESGDYPDLSTVNFKVQYEDGSISSLAADTPELKLVEITRDGQKVDEEPVLYDAGAWTYVYEYKGARANVYFTVLPAMNAGYEITGLPSSWEYSAMPNLTETVSVSGYTDPLVFYGENLNAQIYYIPTDKFEEDFAGATMNEETMNDIEFASRQYYPFDESGAFFPIYVNAGEYYFFLKLSASGNYSGQLTNMQKVTVEKETLEFPALPTLEVSYQFSDYNGPGNAKISEIYRPDYSFSTTNKGGETVTLITSEWLNPDEEVSMATPDKKYKVKLSPDSSLSNYNTDNLYIECTVTATKGYVISDEDTFIFGDAEQLVIDRTFELNECAERGLKFFNSVATNNYETFLASYFRMVNVTDNNGKKLPVYAENSDTPLYEGDEGASAKIIRTDSGTYGYYIILNENAIGKYTFTVSLIDDVNFCWGTYGNDYGNAPIILNYSVVENDPEPYVYISDTDVLSGVFTFEVYLSAEAYDDTLLNTFEITVDDSYTDRNGYVVNTDENLTIDTNSMEVTASDTTDGQVKLTVTLPVTLPDNSGSCSLCFTVTMQTADTYTDISISTYAGLYKS